MYIFFIDITTIVEFKRKTTCWQVAELTQNIDYYFFFFDCYIFLFQLQIIALLFFYFVRVFEDVIRPIGLQLIAVTARGSCKSIARSVQNVFHKASKASRRDGIYLLAIPKMVKLFDKNYKIQQRWKKYKWIEILNRITKNFIFYCILLTSITWIFK